MIDIHTHLIPNIDDGSDSNEETIRLARAAVEEGIRHTVLTPHHNLNWFVNEKDKVVALAKEVEKLIQDAGIPLTVSPSQEVRMNEEFIEELLAGNYLPLDQTGKYYLVEFSWGEFPSFARSYLKQMIDAGITPVIAHPERQKAFVKEPGLLKELIDMGCIAQITATSIIGGYSESIKDYAHQMMADNLIHVIASDAHHTVSRPFNMREALDILEETYSTEYKDYLVTNAEKIFNGEEVTAFKK